MVKLFCRA